ncbi:MAG: oxidoreductase, partial [Coriobacteriia bacterium]|nr:oxidoreductase [Coriobacteriia bacterium]
MEVYDIRPMLAPAISLACAAMVFLAGKNKHWRRFWMLAASTIKFGVVMSMLPGSLNGTVYVYDLIEFTPGIGVGFRADALGMFFSAVSSTLWVLTTIYAIGYMKGEERRVRFFGFFAL